MILELGEITKEVLAFLNCFFLTKSRIFGPLWDQLALSQEMLWHHITEICVRVLNYPLGLIDIMYIHVSLKFNFLLIENGKHTKALQTYLILLYWFWGNLHVCGKPNLKPFYSWELRIIWLYILVRKIIASRSAS